jgi:hypothetical protein
MAPAGAAAGGRPGSEWVDRRIDAVTYIFFWLFTGRYTLFLEGVVARVVWGTRTRGLRLAACGERGETAPMANGSLTTTSCLTHNISHLATKKPARGGRAAARRLTGISFFRYCMYK